MMDERLQPAVSALSERFGAQPSEHRGQVSLRIPPEYITAVCRCLRDEFGFDMLEVETAVDYWPATAPRFHVVYVLYSMAQNLSLSLRVPLDGNEPALDTIESIYPNANWHERETWDMFGIRFRGHSDLRRIVMPADWVGHPLRKDYPLGYEEVQFSFNFDEINRRKPYAKE
jgi:NADH-quinone oxidoreductase subunit C